MSGPVNSEDCVSHLRNEAEPRRSLNELALRSIKHQPLFGSTSEHRNDSGPFFTGTVPSSILRASRWFHLAPPLPRRH